ncbi:MAG: hypothetical protein AAGJ50_12560, partial [Pseudomonadota bacterium]
MPAALKLVCGHPPPYSGRQLIHQPAVKICRLGVVKLQIKFAPPIQNILAGLGKLYLKLDDAQTADLDR